MFGIQCMRALKTHEKLTQIRRERVWDQRTERTEDGGLEFGNCGLQWVGREKKLGITPNSSTFRVQGVDFWLG